MPLGNELGFTLGEPSDEEIIQLPGVSLIKATAQRRGVKARTEQRGIKARSAQGR